MTHPTAPATATPSSDSSPTPWPPVLHVGCGKKKYPGAFGVDMGENTAADLQWNLDDRPWPLPDNTFDLVYAISVLEHVDDVIGVMEEIHRVATPGAEIRIYAPFASSHQVWTDPTHRRGFTSRSFMYFTDRFAEGAFEYSTARFEIEHVAYNEYEDWMWVYRPKWLHRTLERLANRHKQLYEKRFMYWYPIQTIYFKLRATK